MKQYSLDFRQHVLGYQQKHKLTFVQTAKHFDISLRSLFRWHKNIEPCTTRNKPATKVNMAKLAQDIDDFPDAYQRERAVRLGVSKSAIYYALKRLNVTFKKITKASKS